MAKKQPEIECPVIFLTDEEFEAISLKENKTSFLDNLRNASATTGFSARKVRESRERKQSPELKLTKTTTEDIGPTVLGLPERVEYFDDERWERMMEQFDELSPIEDITDEERSYYRRRTDGDKFDEMFKKERSMLTDVLSDIQKRSKIINSKINSMGTKGSYGISKAFVELVEAGTSMDTAKLQVIKAMAELKKTATDLRIKEQKNNPDNGAVETKDSIADRFYKSIISGGAKRFVDTSMQNYRNSGVDMDNSNSTPFNITQPIDATTQTTDNMQGVDDYGYIRNENRNVDICLYRYPDGQLEFVALDEHGEPVYDYELPNDDILATVEIKPLSKFGYDVYQRKYRVVDVDDTSAYAGSKFGNVTNDDKYDY